MLRIISRLLLVSVVAASVLGCRALHSPNNGQEVCGANASVRFLGYLPNASSSVQIQISPTGTGSWTNVGTATTASSGNTVDGTVYYRFDKSMQLAQWTSVAEGGAQLRTFVRARTWVPQSATVPVPYWSYLTTFDVVPPLGTTPLTCGAQQMENGLSAVEANNACASPDSPVVELLAPHQTACGGCTSVVVNGNVVINSPLTAAQYVCTQTINGSLTVTQAAPEIVPLPALQTISGDVTLDHSVPFQQLGSTYYRRRFIETPALTSIGGDVTLYARRSAGPKAVLMGLDAVTSVGGDITITLNDANPHVFAALTSHEGDITIHGDSANYGELDVNASGALASLTQVTGDVVVSDFFSALYFFNALEEIDGDLTIGDLRLHASFGALQDVSGDLELLAVKQIVSTWTNAVDVAGELGIVGHASQTGLTSFPIGPMQAQALRIENNAALAALSGASFQVGAGNITIAGNPALSQCEVNAFLAQQQAGGWTGTASVSGTLPCAR